MNALFFSFVSVHLTALRIYFDDDTVNIYNNAGTIVCRCVCGWALLGLVGLVLVGLVVRVVQPRLLHDLLHALLVLALVLAEQLGGLVVGRAVGVRVV